jgi:hypothetical protein
VLFDSSAGGLIYLLGCISGELLRQLLARALTTYFALFPEHRYEPTSQFRPSAVQTAL